ncbi:MAG: carboxypeptidase-like regulatory domain-containing protein [Hominilimicola sp.]
MNRRNKIISAVIAISMMISMLPARIALATEEGNISDYIKYADSIDSIPANYKGHIWRLESAPEGTTEYDYTITVSAYNMTAEIFSTALQYDNSVVKLVNSAGSEYSGRNPSSYVTYAKPNQYMTDYADNLNYTLKDEGMIFADTTSTILSIEQLSDTDFYQICQQFGVNQDRTTSSRIYEDDWITDYGANYAQHGYGYAYTTPADIVCDLFSLNFKKVDGQTIDENTFMPYYHDAVYFHGGVGITLEAETGKTEWNDEGVCLVGFKKPTVPDQDVSFSKVQNSSLQALNGATIKFYSDSARQNVVEGVTGTTDTNGACTVKLPANTQYYYTISLDGYQSYNGEVEVKESAVSVDSITMTKNTEVKYDTIITVRDADTGGAIDGASVTVDGVGVSGTTSLSGTITAQCTTGEHTLSASKDGYQPPSSVRFIVSAGTGNTALISLTPNRASVTLPTAKDIEGETIGGAQVVVSKTSENKTDEWGQTKTYSAGESVQLPQNTKFTITVSAPGYSSYTAYLNVAEDGIATYYSDSQYTSPLSDTNITINAMSDPYYDVKVTKGDDGKTFTAEVTLNNLKGTKGTFGLKYDKNIFDFDVATDFVLESTDEIKLFELDSSATGEQNLNPVTTNSADGITGYHVFTWKVIDDATELDASSGKSIATYTFTLKDGKTESDITTDAVTVMPYDKTENGITYISYFDNNYSDAYDFFLNYLWRYTDAENTEGSLGEGRIEQSKSSMKGFYQVYVNSQEGMEEADCMFDVMTNITYTNFTAVKSGLEFVITDEDNIPIDDTAIKLYTEDGQYEATITADSTGIAAYPVDASAGDVTYKYTVSRKGYWDEPETGFADVTVKSGETEIVYIQLEEKIYHKPVLQDNDGNEIAEDTAALSGDVLAYNNRDYHFNIDPAFGKQIADTPELQLEAIVEGTTFPVTYDKATNTYILSAANITGEATSQTPDENGFLSNDIIIRMTQGKIEDSDETYTLTALAGTNGSVAYEQGSGLAATDNTKSKIVIDSIAPANNLTGTFTFTADEGYMVEKVFVNGIQIHDFDNEAEFDYSFGNVTEDSNITVIFWNGTEKSTDAVVTLVVGDNGKADVSQPEQETVTSSRKTYIYNAPGTLEFTATPDSGYEMNRVEKEVNGAERETISEPYSVSVAEGDNINVYVSFKATGAEDTSNVFVNAYVKSGKGTISPVGILILNKYDSPTFVMEAKNTDWKAAAVDVNGTAIQNPALDQTFTYTINSIIADTEVGAIFEETTYKVTGIVDLSQGKTLTLLDAKTPAVVEFVRETDGKTITTSTTVSRTDAVFDVQLPMGMWTVKVSKRGYLDYTITGYEVKSDGTSENFGKKSDDTTKKIVPFIGNTTGTGKTVSLVDAGVVGSGLRQGVNENTRAKADVDDDGTVSATSDMSYIMFNYGQRYVTQTYSDFMAN